MLLYHGQPELYNVKPANGEPAHLERVSFIEGEIFVIALGAVTVRLESTHPGPCGAVLNLRGMGGHPMGNINGRVEDMAAFCACCGAEITLKAEACPVCGTPRHGMLPPDLQPALDIGTERQQDDGTKGGKLRRPRL